MGRKFLLFSLLTLALLHFGDCDFFDFLKGGSKKEEEPPSKDEAEPDNSDATEKSEVRFLLRNRKRQSWDAMTADDVPAKVWQETGALKVIIHGFSNDKYNKNPIAIIRDQNVFDIGLAYGMHRKSTNVIIVDWTKLATQTNFDYKIAKQGVTTAGEAVADFLMDLKDEGHFKEWDDVHIIGASMGAHVAGVAGLKIFKETESKVARITGLDPEGPEFDKAGGEEYEDEENALDNEDAEFVDVIHCNAGNATSFIGATLEGRYGSDVQSGHVDFYPNGGTKQGDCGPFTETAEKACSQRKCAEYYAKTVKSEIIGCPCDDWDYFKTGKCDCEKDTGGFVMGDGCPTDANGRLYLNYP